jgi:AcrR family transcriptional regulator
MAELENHLLAETIALGALHPNNKDFSTKEIAEHCGVSEFTLFSRFGSKENLIVQARLAALETMQKEAEIASENAKDCQSFLYAWTKGCINHPSELSFLVNYDIWLSNDSRDSETLETIISRSAVWAKRIFKAMSFPDDKTAALTYLCVSLQVFLTANNVRMDSQADSETLLREISSLTANGLASFRKGSK